MPDWIRRDIWSEIVKAIKATDGSTYIFYITGPGGSGKTIFLRQIGMELGSEDGVKPAFPWSGILDLYHADVNTNSGLEGRLCDALEKAGEFQEYRAEREAFTARREAGEIGFEIEEERAKLTRVFAQCIGQVTMKHRVVVAIDTTEHIKYETDDIQKLCGLEKESTSVKFWLMDQLRQWENCVVLLAGRPDSELHSALQQGVADTPVHYHHIDWRGFTEQEALDYFAQQEIQYPMVHDAFNLDLRRRFWRITGGRPIRLDLAIYVAQHGLGWDEFVSQIEHMAPEEIQDQIDQLLVKHVMQNEQDLSIRTILTHLALARKGLDAKLLGYLIGEWSPDKCQQLLAALKDRSYIKRRPEDGRFFLHDEMYELCDKHLLDAAEVQKKSHMLVAWYDEQIKADLEIDKQRNYQVDSLLYRLRADPWTGYQWYAMAADEAIRYAEVGFEMRLRHELLTFLSSPSPIDQKLLSNVPSLPREIDCDCAGRWVKRYLSRGMNEEAVRVGRTVRGMADRLYPAEVPNSQLALADLNVYYAQAQIYTGKIQDGITILKAVIAQIEGRQRPEDLARQDDPHALSGWRRNLVLGRAHNNLGYADRTPGEPHYHLALQELQKAVPYFRASDLLEEYANTSDNMGRVYALLYERNHAEVLIADSLEIRRDLHREYRTGLSLTSRAIAHLVFDEPHRARRLSEDALSIFERLGGQRGIGLASITVGRSLRKLGDLGIGGLFATEETDNYFRDATRHLKRAVEVFEHAITEPAHLIEAYDELGCACRGRAALARRDEKSPLARSVSREAVQYLNASIQLAEQGFPVMYVDACEDLAQTFFQRQDYDYTELWLQRAEDRIPEQYKITEGIGLPEIPVEECVEEYWQLMGKIELLRGYLAYEIGLNGSDGKASRPTLEKAMPHFAFATAYFENYSERATGLGTTLKQLHDRLKKCRHDDLRFIQEELLPDLEKTYVLDPTRVGEFFEATFGLIPPAK